MEHHDRILSPARRIRGAVGRVYPWLAVLVAGGIVTQVFLAGMNVFLQPRYWGLHVQSGHLIGGLVALLLVVALIGNLDPNVRWMSALMLALVAIQYNHRTIAGLLHLPALAAIHAVNALVLFWFAVALARRTWPQSSRRADGGTPTPSAAQRG